MRFQLSFACKLISVAVPRLSLKTARLYFVADTWYPVICIYPFSVLSGQKNS